MIMSMGPKCDSRNAFSISKLSPVQKTVFLPILPKKVFLRYHFAIKNVSFLESTNHSSRRFNTMIGPI